MDLEHVEGLTPAAAQKLRAAGIADAAALAAAEPGSIAAATGQPPTAARLLAAQAADLLRLESLARDALPTLLAHGIRSIAALAHADPKALPGVPDVARLVATAHTMRPSIRVMLPRGEGPARVLVDDSELASLPIAPVPWNVTTDEDGVHVSEGRDMARIRVGAVVVAAPLYRGGPAGEERVRVRAVNVIQDVPALQRLKDALRSRVDRLRKK